MQQGPTRNDSTTSEPSECGHEGIRDPAQICISENNTKSKSDESIDGPDVGTLDPTDGKSRYDWKSRYPEEVKSQIRREAWYILILLFIALALIFLTWRDVLANMFSLPAGSAATLRKYCYYCFSGLLGGAVFGMKYLYRVVARGYWHEDRQLWRYLSPFIALAVSFAFGTLIDGKFMSVGTQSNGAAIVGFGFLIGYFADQATGKLHEIAGVLFGNSSVKPKEPHSHHKQSQS